MLALIILNFSWEQVPKYDETFGITFKASAIAPKCRIKWILYLPLFFELFRLFEIAIFTVTFGLAEVYLYDVDVANFMMNLKIASIKQYTYAKLKPYIK